MTVRIDDGEPAWTASLGTVATQWGRIGCLGFGGPPTHIVMLRDLCVDRRQWLTSTDFEDAVVACNLLPGPASTQLAIYCAARIRGRLGALVGGLAFILPGLVLVLVLASLFLQTAPPRWIAGAGAGAGAAVAAVAVHAGVGLISPSWRRSSATSRARWVLYASVGAIAAATIGAYLVLVLLLCGITEVTISTRYRYAQMSGLLAVPAPGTAVAGMGGLLAVTWTAFKVGALAYGGGFVIIPLMRSDAVDHYHWMTGTQFLNAVALGQATPGPVTQTVAAVGYAAAGLGGGLLAAAVAFAPSFAFILVGGARFDRLRANVIAQAFLVGAGPAAIGAILGSAVPLARAITEAWQLVVLLGAGVVLLVFRRGVVITLIAAAAVGAILAVAGGPLPH
ncbi:MAG: chromate transporter [Ilumatobacteraceae bacterium]|nr:chromate transporter [Frankiaceae bacterium]